MASSPRVWIGKDWGGTHRLVVIEDAAMGKVRVCTGFTWDEYQEGGLFDQFSGLPKADELVQAIIDRAWEAGFRPNGHNDIKNETEALREHLADMKTIAFHQLKIKN